MNLEGFNWISLFVLIVLLYITYLPLQKKVKREEFDGFVKAYLISLILRSGIFAAGFFMGLRIELALAFMIASILEVTLLMVSLKKQKIEGIVN